MNDYADINDHGIIGDGRSAALITSSGTLDWLCWPRFDSEAIFASLLDAGKGGYWSIRPTGPFASSAKYVEETNVLEIEFTTDNGAMVLTDWMPALTEGRRRSRLLPESLLLRKVTGLSGSVELESYFMPRPAFGKIPPRIRPFGESLRRVEWKGEVLFLRSSLPMEAVGQGALQGKGELSEGQSAYFALAYDTEGPAVLPPEPGEAEDLLQLTLSWWRDWLGRCRYEGPGKEAVNRSALALKLLQYSPSGAVIAAPTTSLPEKMGGDLNWDYRFCWLRDAAFTVRAFLGLGFREEAEAFTNWLLNATRTTRPEVRVLYDLFGEDKGHESELRHLQGYRNSRPVRKGNDARGQFQLDVYGEVISAVAGLFDGDSPMDSDTSRMLVDLGEFVCRHWEEPDHGIWEPRGEPKRYTHSLVLCWTALDCLLKMEEQGKLKLDVSRIPKSFFQKNRDMISDTLRNQAWNEKGGYYTQILNGETLDAGLLLLSWYGFEMGNSDRMKKTCEMILKRLQPKPGHVYRNEESLVSGEGTFGICGFWLAEFLALGGGSVDAARTAFFQSLRTASPLGLIAEEADPISGEALGNFPQAFSHVGLINAALSLARREKEAADELD